MDHQQIEKILREGAHAAELGPHVEVGTEIGDLADNGPVAFITLRTAYTTRRSIPLAELVYAVAPMDVVTYNTQRAFVHHRDLIRDHWCGG